MSQVQWSDALKVDRSGGRARLAVIGRIGSRPRTA